ncbi:hypothetical protein [Planococcus rifietoensis]|uniref:hypothetical protein n=1 Tax=Planococcus rifietoensis TaxID=200991 RepID=UPI00384E171B
MEFKRLPIILKRYDFGSKMRIAQKNSMEIMDFNGIVRKDKLVNRYLPWELETFALLSISTGKEDDNQNFQGVKGVKKFNQIMNSIRNYAHPKIFSKDEEDNLFDYFLIVTGLTQFPIQEDIHYKSYRYQYIFNFKNEKVDMGEEFRVKFENEYQDYLDLGIILTLNFMSKNHSQVLKYIMTEYKHIVKNLTIERQQFIELQSKITTNYQQYLYGFKYYYQYPFITYNEKIYLPLPHLIMQSVTSSLLFRLTEGNKELRAAFGKEALENYILHILKMTNQFDEIVGDFRYPSKNGGRDTLDAMVRRDEYCFMIDSKSMAPRLGLRDLTKEDIQATVCRLAKAVVQVYRHLTERLFKEYFPFGKNSQFLPENIFGAVIVLEESYIRREVVIKKAADLMSIREGTEEYRYLCSNIKILSLYGLERMVFEDHDIIAKLIENRDSEKNWFAYNLLGNEEINQEVCEEIELIIKRNSQTMEAFIEKLKKAGFS